MQTSFLWLSLALTLLCVLPLTPADPSTGSASNIQLESEVSELQGIKRYGYIPSRGRKSEDRSQSRDGGEEVEKKSEADNMKRAFHGARGKKTLPMLYNNMNDQWANQMPERSHFPSDQILSRDRNLLSNLNRGMHGNEAEEGDEEGIQMQNDVVQLQPPFSSQPFYSRLLALSRPTSMWRMNPWTNRPANDDEVMGKRMVYYTSRG